MPNSDKVNNYKFYIINVLFALFPISFVLGNSYINLNIVLFTLCTLFFYGKELNKLKLNTFDKILIFFFFYSFVVLLIKFFQSKSGGLVFPSVIIDKTFFYTRFLFLYISLRMLMNIDILKINWFFSTCAFISIFVCVDIFIQYFFGADIFGIKPIMPNKLSGPFGEELIAGGFIQRFSLFALFLPFILSQKRKLNKILIQLFLVFIFLTGIILSGNRMPFILYVLALFLFFLLDVDFRKKILVVFLFFITILVLLLFNNKTLTYNMANFYKSGEDLIDVFFINKIDLWKKQPDNKLTEHVEGSHPIHVKILTRPYVMEFYCFNYIWKKNIFLGGGIRSYRTHAVPCNTHPHNYYFEILDDLGLFGFFIIIILFFNALYKVLSRNRNKTFLNDYTFNTQTLNNAKIIPFFLIFLTELFPIRSSGSFFTTNNAAYIFIILALLISLIEKNEIKK